MESTIGPYNSSYKFVDVSEGELSNEKKVMSNNPFDEINLLEEKNAEERYKLAFAKVHELFIENLSQNPIVICNSKKNDGQLSGLADGKNIVFKNGSEEEDAVINKLASFFGVDADLLTMESSLEMDAYNNTPITTDTSWFTLSGQYLAVNSNSDIMNGAMVIPIQASGSANLLNSLVTFVGTKVIEAISNRFVAKTPEELIAVDFKQSAMNFMTSELFESKSEKK